MRQEVAVETEKGSRPARTLLRALPLPLRSCCCRYPSAIRSATPVQHTSSSVPKRSPESRPSNAFACPAPLFLVAAEALNILRRIESLNGYGSQVGHQTNGHRGKSLFRALGAKEASSVTGFTLHGH